MEYRERYEGWLNDPYFDEATKEELRSIAEDDNEIKERFYKDLEFGSAGLRGIIGAGTNRMNIYTVRKATQGLANYIISKEGQTENVSQMIHIQYGGKVLNPDMDKIFSACKIPMPTDAKRNMMNASSNFEIIQGILKAVRHGGKAKLHCPGVFGEIGGYPVILDGTGQDIKACIDEEYFDIDSMRKKNRESIYLDGIENIETGSLFYTDELIEKFEKAFGISLMKQVKFEEIETAAQFLIAEVIEKQI